MVLGLLGMNVVFIRLLPMQHPGGDEVILAEAGTSIFPLSDELCVQAKLVTLFRIGKDATEAFEDVGHSDEARDLLKDMLVGDFEGGVCVPFHAQISDINA